MSNRQKPAQLRPLNGPTFWKGRPTMARRGTAVIAFDESVDVELRGQRVDVVEVAINGVDYKRRYIGLVDKVPTYEPGLAYLDDRKGHGWRTVTKDRGATRKAPDMLPIRHGSFRPAAGDVPTPRPLDPDIDAICQRRDLVRPTHALRIVGAVPGQKVARLFGESAIVRIPWRGTTVQAVKGERVDSVRRDFDRLRRTNA